MGVFEEVKRNVTVRQAAERYGFKPDRSGLIRCIFHNDATPSMKVDRRYYCFGCGCTGDAVDFTAQLFGIGLRDAAVKLADDFGIRYSSRPRDQTANRQPERTVKKEPEKTSKKEPEQSEQDKWKADYVRCVRAYLDYRILLLDWRKRYAPKTREEGWNEQFGESLRNLTIVEYYLDTLLFGDQSDKEFMVDQLRKKVEQIEQKCRDYYGGGR